MSSKKDEELNIYPDRPLPCSECKKPIAILHTQIIGDSFIQTAMCADCPELFKEMHGENAYEDKVHEPGKKAGLACGECGTTLASIKVGHPVGCSTCYEIFDDLLLFEIISASKVPERVVHHKKTYPLHIGLSPGKAHPISPSLRLIALNEALDETLQREDYEQAAVLRDEIQQLTKETEKEQKQNG